MGIDALLNLKGYHDHHGLEDYHSFETHNLGSQVPNSVLVAKAIEIGADAILVSQTVTQQNLHVSNPTIRCSMDSCHYSKISMSLGPTCGKRDTS